MKKIIPILAFVFLGTSITFAQSKDILKIKGTPTAYKGVNKLDKNVKLRHYKRIGKVSKRPVLRHYKGVSKLGGNSTVKPYQSVGSLKKKDIRHYRKLNKNATLKKYKRTR